MCIVKNCCEDYDSMLLSIVNVGVNVHVIVGFYVKVYVDIIVNVHVYLTQTMTSVLRVQITVECTCCVLIRWARSCVPVLIVYR